MIRPKGFRIWLKSIDLELILLIEENVLITLAFQHSLKFMDSSLDTKLGLLASD